MGPLKGWHFIFTLLIKNKIQLYFLYFSQNILFLFKIKSSKVVLRHFCNNKVLKYTLFFINKVENK